MSEIETRRLFISDDQWERTSASWKQLKPLCHLNYLLDPGNETPEQCFARLNAAGFCIPFLVIEQWIYPHYYKWQTVDNYGWIDYNKARFTETMLSVDTLARLYVIEDYRDWVRSRSNLKPFANFGCIAKDLEHWKTYGTWRIPPVVIDVASFPPAPGHAELVGPSQLVEGHSRLGYLYALLLADMLAISEHRVFLMQHCEEQD